LLIFAFFEVFVGDLGFQCGHPHPDSPPVLKFFYSVG